MSKQQIRTLFVFAVTVALSEMDLASYRLVVVILLGLLRGGAVESLSFSHYSGVQSQDPNDVRFYLYPNSTDPEFHQELTYLDPTSILRSGFRPSARTVFLTHGFTQNYKSSFPQLIKNAYLMNSNENENIIAVDWGKLSSPSDSVPIPLVKGLVKGLLSYRQAVENVPVVGKRMQEFISFLIVSRVFPTPAGAGALIHLIGHSLGAHASGLAGLYLQQRHEGIKLGRITGTDPAKPRFEDKPRDERLDAIDADFVDVIHTNAGELGYVGALGAVDFFINGGGPTQPGCALFDSSPSCSHDASYKYYAESILNRTMLACPCGNEGCLEADKVVFGEYVRISARGSYCINLASPQQTNSMGTDWDSHKQQHGLVHDLGSWLKNEFTPSKKETNVLN